MSQDLEAEIAALPSLGRAGLQERWRSLFKAAPPAAFTPDLLGRGIAWRLQEKAPSRRSSARTPLRSGNRLVRRWRGRTYVVEAIDGGLMYDGERFTSLSVIATKITGTRWSGPKFFGLVA